MAAPAFDSLAYFDKLKAAGVPDAQARVQAQTLQAFCEAQNEALRQFAPGRDESFPPKDSLSGFGAHMDTRLNQMANRLIRWQIGLTVSIMLALAKGFGWLGF